MPEKVGGIVEKCHRQIEKEGFFPKSATFRGGGFPELRKQRSPATMGGGRIGTDQASSSSILFEMALISNGL
jgi:hypothetical protein